jgi:predicted Zn-dependent protease
MNGDNQGGGGGLFRLVPIIIGVAVIGFTMARGCQTGPFGRRQVVAMNADQETALGAQAYREVLQKSDVIRSGPIVDAVEDIARRLARATRDERFLKATDLKDQKFEWSVSVVRSKEINAFCLPGGKIVVYTGILPVAETNAGLATVMGHEIAHALAHHGAERMAQQRIAQIGAVAAGASLGDMDNRQRMAVMMAINAGAQYGILKYSRKHESEADHVGLLLMAVAGYNPEEAVKFWQRMAKATSGGRRPPEFMSTHPSHQTRVRDLINWMKEAQALYRESDRQKNETLPGL